MNDIDPRMADGTVSIYENDATEGFPVLKAFQQYIDAEQAKARKRLLMMGVFFGFLMTIMIAVFVMLLINANARNQALNDRLVEYAMKDRDRGTGPVVVQPPQDNSAILSLASKLEEMKNALMEEKARAAKPTAESVRGTGEAKPSADALEVERLKALLAFEKEKSAAEREKKRQLELEAYRREHYPELYGIKSGRSEKKRSLQDLQRESEEADREIESILEDDTAVTYFEEDDNDDDAETKARPKRRKQKAATRPSRTRNEASVTDEKTVEKEAVSPSEDSFTIPVDVKDASGSSWSIPQE